MSKGQRINHSLDVKLLGVGSATPMKAFTQQDVLNLMEVQNEKIQSIYLNNYIERRYLSFPQEYHKINRETETQGDLISKHKTEGILIGSQAINNCLKNINADLDEIRFLCCVTSTGMLVPGFSALLCNQLGLNQSCSRLDIVGMGCNAGLNGLNATANWAKSNPGQLAIVLCVEVCSAAYIVDDSIEVSVVNSLFGDGAAAAGLSYSPDSRNIDDSCPSIVSFSSKIITEAIDAMRFQWDGDKNRLSFLLERDVPYLIGAHVRSAVADLIDSHKIRKSQISQWIVHSGGKKVIDALRVNIGLSAYDLRHTLSVLRDYGNVSSGSFLLSYEKLALEKCVTQGDFGIMITMGPGATIETALLRW